jgi:hypothetical protein
MLVLRVVVAPMRGVITELSRLSVSSMVKSWCSMVSNAKTGKTRRIATYLGLGVIYDVIVGGMVVLPVNPVLDLKTFQADTAQKVAPHEREAPGNDDVKIIGGPGVAVWWSENGGNNRPGDGT